MEKVRKGRQIAFLQAMNDAFYLSKSEPNRSCLLALQNILLQAHPNIIESTKYGMPCFCYKKRPVCYLWVDKKTDIPYILWVDGQQLHQPELESGDRSKMKILRIDPSSDIPVFLINELISIVIGRYIL